VAGSGPPEPTTFSRLLSHYAGDEVLVETEYDVVLARPKCAAQIYVNTEFEPSRLTLRRTV
jgi:hypothetical protein